MIAFHLLGILLPLPPIPFKTPIAPLGGQECEVSPGRGLGEAPPGPGEGEWGFRVFGTPTSPSPVIFPQLSACLAVMNRMVTAASQQSACE